MDRRVSNKQNILVKQETKFRNSQVLPFLKSLRNTFSEPIQQMAIVGSPDYLLCCNGDFIALELKIDDKNPRKLQAYKLAEVTRCGGLSLVATPSNWKDIKQIILNRDKAPRGKNENTKS